jgi:hypothetical protein
MSVDGDTIPSNVDNCPEVQNELQIDSDNDGIGDPCDPVLDTVAIPPLVRIDSVKADETTGILRVSGLLEDPLGDAATSWSIYDCFDQPDASDLFCELSSDCVVKAEAELNSSVSCKISGRRSLVIDAFGSTGNSSDSILLDISGKMTNGSKKGKGDSKGSSKNSMSIKAKDPRSGKKRN